MRRSSYPWSRRGIRTAGLFAAVVLCSFAAAGCQVPLGPVAKVGVDAVRLPETSDPSAVATDGAYFIYGSNNDKRAPVTRLTDLGRAYSLPEKNSLTVEGMPVKPAWAASSTQLWAPSVARFGDRWIMFFAADRVAPSDPGNPQCIGRAIAASPLGPFVPEALPVHCGAGGHGALDPDVFTDAVGNRWLLAAFGNTETPIQSMPLDANGNIVGGPVAILGRVQPWEQFFIENPSMVYDRKQGNYLLAYSAGRWWEAGYSTGIARCASPTGPCTSDPTGPWIATSNGRSGPGGLTFFQDLSGAQRAIYSSFALGQESTNGGRSASIEYLRTDPAVTLTVVK